MKFKDLRFLLWERRNNQGGEVQNERRVRVTRKQADKHLKDSIDRLLAAVKPPDGPVRRVANDIQQVVKFFTFAEICRFGTSKDFAVRFCRNPLHEAANTGAAICNEELCPVMLGATA